MNKWMRFSSLLNIYEWISWSKSASSNKASRQHELRERSSYFRSILNNKWSSFLMIATLLPSCTNHTKERINFKNKTLQSILFADTCNHSKIVDSLLSDKDIDFKTVDLASMYYSNCNESRKAINILRQYSNDRNIMLSEDQNLRLSEAYRIIGITDSALYYLDLFEEICTDKQWPESRFYLWRMQIAFEGKRFEESIDYAKHAISLTVDTSYHRKEWPHEYIAQSYYYLDSLERYCEYSKKYAPRVYLSGFCDSLYKEIK